MHATPQEVTVTVSETPSATDAPELAEQAAAAPAAAEPAVDEAPATRGRSRTAAKTAARSTKVARPKKTAKDDVGPGILGRLIRFVREVVAELQKVIWPTRKELITYTSVVVVFVAIIMTVVALLDLGFAKAMFAVFGGNPITNSTPASQ